jgi:chromosome segregation ATPase
MDGEDKTARERKQRMRAKREAAGVAQVSGWVPAARRAYAREVLKAVAEGANSLPPDPELSAALDAAKADLIAAHVEIEAAKAQIAQIEMMAERQRQALEAERDAARAAEAAEREKVQATATEAQVAAKTAQEAQKRATEALGRAEKAETAIRQAKSLPGVRGRLVRWMAGDVLE